MQRSVRYFIELSILVLLLVCPVVRADSWTFTLVPMDGSISGPAGSTIGWGYTITNDSSTDWLVPSNLSADLFQNGTGDGSYFDFPVIAPGGTATMAFDATAFTGLYGLTWDAGAPDGFTNTGTFILSAEFWDGDPFAGGSFLMDAPDESAAYSATVTSSTNVPEPSATLLAAVGLAAVALRKLALRCPARS